MAIPSGKHNDWIWPFSLIPRGFNAVASENEPVKLLGNATGHLDVPPKGTWVLAWPLYFALRTKSGWHFRFGIRYDYVDRYYTFPAIALKKIP